jgi:hypothetical protein
MELVGIGTIAKNVYRKYNCTSIRLTKDSQLFAEMLCTLQHSYGTYENVILSEHLYKVSKYIPKNGEIIGEVASSQ